MLIKSNAKINLGLSIIERRTDGFHNIESIFLPIPWFDKIEIKKTDKTSFSANGVRIDGTAEDNLCMKAYSLLKNDFQLPNVGIQLEKNIPIGAGLGGGSSNAAFVLKGLNQLFDLKIGIEGLETYADQLGSDCSFFIKNQASYVSGKGEIIEAENNLNLKTFCIVVNPNLHISTKEAYAQIVPKKATTQIREAILMPSEQWQKTIKNDFEEPLIKRYPILQKLRSDLEEMGAYYISMSGSGSTFFAFFKKKCDTILFDNSYQYKNFELNV